jgi:hypothetical protein
MQDEIVVVSGLPRSGTSLVMQMLAAGGMPILTDEHRQADEDNPKGYFEYEAVKRIARDQAWLGKACGKALKVVVPLVCFLPGGYRYRVILIERDYDEILASQATMIERRGESIPDSPERRARLRQEYARIMEQTKNLLGGRADVQLLQLQYDKVLNDPAEAAQRISTYAGGALEPRRMAVAVDTSLHRNVVPERKLGKKLLPR